MAVSILYIIGIGAYHGRVVLLLSYIQAYNSNIYLLVDDNLILEGLSAHSAPVKEKTGTYTSLIINIL